MFFIGTLYSAIPIRFEFKLIKKYRIDVDLKHIITIFFYKKLR